MKIKIPSAEIIDPNSSQHHSIQNIYINNGIIEQITSEDLDFDIEVEGKELVVSPGWFDLWAQFGDPGEEQNEDLTSGLKTAATGGFTGVALLPNTRPSIQSKNDITYAKSHNKNSVAKAFPYASITIDNKGESFTEMLDLWEAGAVGYTDGKYPIAKADILMRTLVYLQKIDAVLFNRPADPSLNMFGVMHEGRNSTALGMKGMPRLAEEVMIHRDLRILEYTGGKLHFANISSSGSVELVREAKQKGLEVTCDVAVYSLLYDDSLLFDFDSNYKVDPPLREHSDIQSLIEGLRDGTIDAISSSHHPQDTEFKNLEFDLAEFGMLGLQTFLPTLLKSELDLEWGTLIEKIALNPRKILGLDLPTISEGSVAELTVFSQNEEWDYNEESNSSKSLNSPMLDSRLRGKVIATINHNNSTLVG